MRYKDVSLIICMLLFSKVSFGGELYEAYNGIRAMGMGGATVAVVNDETALITNPAALGKLRSSYITVLDPEVHGNKLEASVAKDNSYNPLETSNPQKILDALKKHPDQHFNTSAYLFPSIVIPNFGMGLLGTYSYDAEYKSTNKLDLRYRNDYGFLVGYNLKFFDGIIKFGFNAKYINRVEMDKKDIDGSSTGLAWGDLVNEGAGFASDAGLILTAPFTYLPTLAAVWRDIGNTNYGSAGMFYNGRPRPESTKSDVDVGISISPILGKYVRMQITADYQGLLTVKDEDDKAKRIHAGLEFNFYDKLFVRGGWNERYWTAGLEIAAMNTQLQFATWGEEIGTSTAHKEDRRYGLKFAFRF